MFDMNEGDFDDLQEALHTKDFMVEKAGILTVKKEVETPYPLTFVCADANYMEMFHRDLLEGA